MPAYLKKSNNKAHLEASTKKHIVSHLGKTLELNDLEAPDGLQINTVTHQATQQNPQILKPTCHHSKKSGHYQNQCRQLNGRKDRTRNNTNSADNSNNNKRGQTNYNSNNKVPKKTKANQTNNQKDRRLRPIYLPCETCGKTRHSTEKLNFGANAAKKPPPRNRRQEGQYQVQQRNAQNNSDGNVQAAGHTIN